MFLFREREVMRPTVLILFHPERPSNLFHKSSVCLTPGVSYRTLPYPNRYAPKREMFPYPQPRN